MRKQLVSEGLIVYIQGYEFLVSNVREVIKQGEKCVEFTATCTENERNDSIRNTGYNGGTYGGNRFSNYAW